MRTYVSLWDAFFGKKAVIELPDARGGVRKIRVTVKWMQKMQRDGKMKPADKQYVQVHILDPEATLFDAFGLEGGAESDHRVEHWVVGEDVPLEHYKKFVDPKTHALYAMTRYEDGNCNIYLVQRELWDATRA